MNRKIAKRFASLVLAVSCTAVCALQYTNNVMALENGGNDSLYEYAEDMVANYLKGSEYASLKDISLSAPFDYYNFETMNVCGNVYVVYHNDDVIGMLCIGEDTGEYSSSYLADDFECIQNAFEEGTDVAFGCYQQKVLMYDGDTYSKVDTDQTVSVNDNGNITLSDVSPVYTGLDKTVDLVEPYSTVFSTSIDIKPVSNEIVGGVGICWAASIAAKYNYIHEYEKGDSGYLTARVVYDLIGNKLGGTPSGTVTYMRSALNLFGLTNTYKAGALSGTAIYGELYQDNAVIASIATSDYSSAHSVIIAGIRYTVDGNNANVVYQLCDSNFDGLKTTYQQEESPYNHSIKYYDSAYGFTFTEWYQSYSYKWGD